MPTTNKQVVDALKRAAENLLGRTLTQTEADELVRRFNAAPGLHRERAREALRQFTGLTEEQLRVKAASSDNTDRLMGDLQQTMDDWKPGT